MATNSLICYLFIKVSYIKSLIITKFINIYINFKVYREVSCTYINLIKFKKRQVLVNSFYDNQIIKSLLHLKIIIGMMSFMTIRINLIQAWQIIIVDLEYIFYVKEQVKTKIIRIRQINNIIIYILIYYIIKIESKIKYCYYK